MQPYAVNKLVFFNDKKTAIINNNNGRTHTTMQPGLIIIRYINAIHKKVSLL
jgi:hypothetical protein